MEMIGGKIIYKEFGPTNRLADIQKIVTSSLTNAKDVYFRGEARQYPTPCKTELMKKLPQFNLTPVEPDFILGNNRIPMRIWTQGEQAIITEVQQDKPNDPHFYKLVSDQYDPS